VAPARDPGYAGGHGSGGEAAVGEVYTWTLVDVESLHERGVVDLCARLREGGSLACDEIDEAASREMALPPPHR